MIVFPPSKLNLGLQITEKRTDGYHNLQTVFYQFPLCDILEIVIDEQSPSGFCHFVSTGLEIPEGKNLCIKAYELLDRVYNLPAVRIHLHKIIPMGAGLGGGSSDATYTLRLLNSLCGLTLSQDQLRSYALELGSDCPLFVEEEVQYAQGRGEVLCPIEIDLKDISLLVVNPKIHISTSVAFSGVSPQKREPFVEIINEPVEFWKGSLTNDFEESLFVKYPDLRNIKEKMYAHGACYAAMSGSGSTMFALFKGEVPSVEWPEHYFVWSKRL